MRARVSQVRSWVGLLGLPKGCERLLPDDLDGVALLASPASELVAALGLRTLGQRKLLDKAVNCCRWVEEGWRVEA